MKKYTYADLYTDIIAVCNNADYAIPAAIADRMREKAEQGLEAQARRAESAATATRKKVSKVSPETMLKVSQIKAVLSGEFMTTAEINEKLGSDFSPLTVSNCMKYIEGWEKGQKIMTVTDSKGLVQQKLYAAYRLTDCPTIPNPEEQ